MGMWRQEAEPMARMMSKFPAAPDQVPDQEGPEDQLLAFGPAGEP